MPVNRIRSVKPVVILFCMTLVGVLVWGIRGRAGKQSVPVCRDCNVILVSLDTLSGMHLPCLGYEKNTAPNLCAFGRSNVLFEHAYGNANYTLPTHVSLFTGAYPSTHGITKEDETKLSESFPFLPSILKAQGYATTFLLEDDNPHMPRFRVYNRGIDTILDSREVSLGQALSRFEEQVKSGTKSFLFIHSYYVHAPYKEGDIPAALRSDKYAWMLWRKSDIVDISDTFLINMKIALRNDLINKVYADPVPYEHILSELARLGNDFVRQRQLIRRYPRILSEYQDKYDPLIRINVADQDELTYLRAIYDERIRSLDSGPIAELLEFVKNPAIAKNTVVIILSDHGEDFGEHGQISHTTLYDTNTRVLWMMAAPGIAARTVSEYVQTVDVTPTLLALLGISEAGKFDGLNVLETLTGGRINPRIMVAQKGNQVTVRSGKWKLFVDTRSPELIPTELYDVERDPWETENVLFANLKLSQAMLRQYETAFPADAGVSKFP